MGIICERLQEIESKFYSFGNQSFVCILAMLRTRRRHEKGTNVSGNTEYCCELIAMWLSVIGHIPHI
jgi:hypothetical protein